MSSEIRNYMQTHVPQPKNVSKMILGQTDLLVYDVIENAEENCKPIEVLCTLDLESLYPETNGVPKCPYCRNPTRNIQDYRSHCVTDLPIRTRKAVLRILYNTYKCTSCNKAFTPTSSFINAKGKNTKRLKAVSAGRKSPFRVGKKSPISVGG